jgi:hypothetical protein
MSDGGGDRYPSDSAEYQSALLILREPKYQQALDNLERLVIWWLFELTKLGISGIGSLPFIDPLSEH